ncbi:spermine oxidase-like [Macrobrachium nipponense]|uniref:spermine oxidase-like n=1 Tax=Macrobrachium nipponense TaxID=159736 RepID=UPI0030C7B26A
MALFREISCFAFLVLGFIFEAAGEDHPCDGIIGDTNNWIRSARRTNVVVIGGGAAGLTAAKTLIQNQAGDVLLLEAQDYLGGRVKTIREGPLLVEEGAGWISGGSANPLFNLAKRLGGMNSPVRKESYDWRAKTSNGRNADPSGFDVAASLMEECDVDPALVPYHSTGYGRCFLDKFPVRYFAAPSEKEAWLHYLHMWVNKEAGTNDWMDKSARDADHFTEWDMADLRPWRRGFDTFIQYLRQEIPASQIKTSSPVCKVFWDLDDAEGSVLLVTSAREAYLADYVVITTSVGHLKERHRSMFEPALPSEYLDTLNGVELGVTDKILIGWNEPWWGKRPLDLHIIFQDFNLPSEESWLYSIMEFVSTQRHDNVLQAVVTGESAKLMENLPEEEVKNQVVRHLKRVTGQNVPPPSFFRR